MNTVKIQVQAFCSEFSIQLKRRKPPTLRSAIQYVRGTLGWETAIVKSVSCNGEIIINEKAHCAENIKKETNYAY